MKYIILLLLSLTFNNAFSSGLDSLIFDSHRHDLRIIRQINNGFCNIYNQKADKKKIIIEQYSKNLVLKNKTEIQLNKKMNNYLTVNEYFTDNKLYLLYTSIRLKKIQVLIYDFSNNKYSLTPIIDNPYVKSTSKYFKKIVAIDNFVYIQNVDLKIMRAINNVLRINIKTNKIDQIYFTSEKVSVLDMFYNKNTQKINITTSPYLKKDIKGGAFCKVFSSDSLGNINPDKFKTLEQTPPLTPYSLFMKTQGNKDLISGTYKSIYLEQTSYLSSDVRSGLFISKYLNQKLIWNKVHRYKDIMAYLKKDSSLNIRYLPPKIINNKIIYSGVLYSSNHTVTRSLSNNATSLITRNLFHNTFVIAFDKNTGNYIWSKTFLSQGTGYTHKPSTLKSFTTTNDYINIIIQNQEKIEEIRLDSFGNIIGKSKELYKIPKYEKEMMELISNNTFFIENSFIYITKLRYPKNVKYVVKKTI